MLRDCFGPCFRLMLRLPDSPPTGRTDVRREAERLLEEAGRLALHGREAATVETARRMVEAWMDETALASHGKAAPPGWAIHSNAAGGRDGAAGTGFSTKSAACLRTEPKMPSWPRSPCVASDSDSEDIFITIPMALPRAPSACRAVRLYGGSASFPTRSISAKGKPPDPACRASADGAFRRIAADLLGHMATSAEPGVYREPTSSRRECGTSRKR